MAEHPIERRVAIDKQISFLWACYRKWYDLGTNTGINPIDALTEIDALLLERHGLGMSQGELVNPDDIASAPEWGSADTGASA